MPGPQIRELQRVFVSRLDTLSHILDAGEAHLGAALDVGQARLAPDMLPLGTQVAFACNQPRGFSQWCAGEPVQNLDPAVPSLEIARAHIADTHARVLAIACDDGKLEETKRIGLGGALYCELPGHGYVSEYLLPNFYFHITTTYAILRMLGVPVGKADYMRFLLPHVRSDG
ncbi:MAG: DUF1993 domain-containing protein [Xanthomonadales bacterium]|nr:DUF1993 domain-containing protein [Xanthomonadales bacterium]